MYAVKKTSYVVCNFDIDLLPVRYNLPIVCPPRDWDVSSEAKRGGVGRPQTLSGLTGGQNTTSVRPPLAAMKNAKPQYKENCEEPTLVREDWVGPTYGVPVVMPIAAPGS
nr:DNA-dependent RNA polymerase [Ipomoea batatas]